MIEIASDRETLMACDAILLNGNCIVNESMLTGESVPVIKTPLPYPEQASDIFDVEEHKRNILFNGTKIVQTRNYDNTKVRALVIRTGFFFITFIIFGSSISCNHIHDIIRHFCRVLSFSPKVRICLIMSEF